MPVHRKQAAKPCSPTNRVNLPPLKTDTSSGTKPFPVYHWHPPRHAASKTNKPTSIQVGRKDAVATNGVKPEREERTNARVAVHQTMIYSFIIPNDYEMRNGSRKEPVMWPNLASLSKQSCFVTRATWPIIMETRANDDRILCWKAGYGANSSVRFGGRWAETCFSDEVTRRPSTLCHTFAGRRCRYPIYSGAPGTCGY